MLLWVQWQGAWERLMPSFHHAQACSGSALSRLEGQQQADGQTATCSACPSSPAPGSPPPGLALWCPPALSAPCPGFPQSSSTRALPEPCQCPQAHCEAFSNLSFWVPSHLPGAPLAVLIVEWGSAPSPTWGQGARSGLPSAALDHAGQWRSESPCLTHVQHRMW